MSVGDTYAGIHWRSLTLLLPVQIDPRNASIQLLFEPPCMFASLRVTSMPL